MTPEDRLRTALSSRLSKIQTSEASWDRIQDRLDRSPSPTTRRRVAVATFALVLSAASFVGIWTGFDRSVPPSPAVSAAPTPQLVPQVTGTFQLAHAGQLSAIAYGADSLWVAVRDAPSSSGTILRMSVPHGDRQASIQVPVIPGWEDGGGGLAFDDGALFIAGTQFDPGPTARVLRVDPATNEVSDVVTIDGPRAADVAEGAGIIWLLVQGDNWTPTVYRVDATTGRIDATIPLQGSYGRSITVVGGSVLVSVLTSSGQNGNDAVDGTAVYRIDAQTNAITLHEALDGLGVMGSGDGQVWAATGTSLLQLDPESGSIVSTQRIENTGDAIGVGDGGVWFLDPKANRGLSRFDPSTGEATPTRDDKGGVRLSLAVSPGAAWVLDQDGTMQRVQMVPDCPPVSPGVYGPTMTPSAGPAGSTVTITGRVPLYGEDGAFREPTGTLQVWWNVLDQGDAWLALLPGGDSPSPALPGYVSLVAEIPIPDACTYEVKFTVPDVGPGSYPLTLLSSDATSATSYGAGLVFDVGVTKRQP